MAENIVAGLFGMTPQMYQGQQYQQDLRRGAELAQLSPGAAAQANLMASVGQLGRGFAGALGIEDPQLQLISTRNAIAQQIDQTDPESILKGAQMLAQAGDQQGAMALAQYARQAQSDVAQTKQRQAAALASTAQAARERQQSTPNDIQIANEIATLEDALSRVEDLPADPERTRAKNLLNTRLTELRRLTSKGDKPETKTTIQKLQEYAATLPPGSPLLAQVQEAIKAEGSSKGTKLEVNVPAAQQAKAISKNKTDLASQVETDAYGATDRVTLARNLKSLLPTAFTGVDSNVKLQASRVAEVFGINIQGVPDSQIIDTILGEMTIGAASKLKGALSDKDVKFLKETIGTRGLSLKTLQFVADKIETDALIDSELNEVVNKYVASGGDLNKFNFATERKDVAEKVRKDLTRLKELREKSKTQ
jgi:negative regulator of genetic competence, sporulation and motility